MRKNESIRKLIESNRLKHYEVADQMGISDSRFSVWLRKELEGERKERTMKAIEKLTSN
ncbi:hypothetical protein [Vagococcus carniphilus]|uniref:hypothetical protein n=1 Tax=Vagococcus carniphilus TaxID=218144 RepID=UPI0028920E73|nr:hypothetical protein [Vagococcus carniphilus]MDT2839317.1 hypothetical protein [Vagococcus carniphilus]